jgi:hypothetical protein
MRRAPLRSPFMPANSLSGPSPSPRASHAPPAPARPRARHAFWLVFLAIPIVEVAAHAVRQSRVVPFEHWEAAAAHVRAEWREGDVVTAAPRWADPLMRAAVGDLLDLRSAGRSDLAPFRRLWSLSIRGHRADEAPLEAPEHVATFGRVRVERWTLPAVRILHDLVEHVDEAEVELVEHGQVRPCRFVRTGRPQGGGLGTGPITPADRHVCDAARPWLWVGATVQEDLAMLPRRCVWQHPPGGADRVRATFRDVPLGDHLVLYAGLWWEHERTMDGGPVDVVVRLDGEEIGRLHHVDGDGWKRLEVAIPEARHGGRGAIAIEVSAPNPHLRSLCWAATTRARADGESQ